MFTQKDLKEFEELLIYLEEAKDPWYLEKLPSKLRELKSFQIRACPCELHNTYDNSGKIILENMSKILELLKRSNKFNKYRANGTTSYSNDNNKTIRHIPPVHADGCVCDPSEETSKTHN